MQVPALTHFTRALRIRPSFWLVTLAVIGVCLYAATSHRRAPLPPVRAATPAQRPAPSAEPVTAEVITSKATDRYKYLADVLRQLGAHPQSTCRDEVAGPQRLQQELAKASELKAQGLLRDASLVLTSIEKRLERKFQMECLKLG